MIGPRAKEDVVILDSLFSYNLDAEMKRWLANKEEYIPGKTKMDYLSGKLPLGRGKDWKFVNYVYMPILLNNNHWVALEIDMDKRTVFVLDCDVNLIKIADLHVCLNHLVSLVPVWISHYEAMADFTNAWGTKKFFLSRNPTLPRNKSG